MEMEKSTRHQKIIGDFGENLICNWLSRSGFEVSIVDHTGIDIIAYNPKRKQRIGITVKSRTRSEGTESDSVNLLSYRKENTDRDKLLKACEAFGCEPWLGIYIETTDYSDIYLTSLDNYDKKYRGESDRVVDTWKMKDKDKLQYDNDPEVKHVRIHFYLANWKW